MTGINKSIGNELDSRGITLHKEADADAVSGVLQTKVLEKIKNIGPADDVIGITTKLDQIVEEVSNAYLSGKTLKRENPLPDDSVYLLEAVAVLRATVSKVAYNTAVEEGIIAPSYSKLSRTEKATNSHIYG